MLKFFKVFVALLFAGSFLLPQVTFSATSSLNIGQRAGDPEPGGGGNYDQLPPQITDVVISVKTNSVTVNWNTNEITSTKFSWGESTEYRDGLIYSRNFIIPHSANLTNLKEKTLYYFLITSSDLSGNRGFYEGQFITGSSPDVTPPFNVTKFLAKPNQSVIELSWVKPLDTDFAFTRIVRSSTFFPLDPYNGDVVYEGDGQEFIDRDVVAGTLYSYSAFARDMSGNFSSGSLASAMIAWFSESPESGQDYDPPVTDLKFIYSKDIPRVLLNQKDFIYSYGETRVPIPTDNIRLPVSNYLNISIPKINVPSDTQFLVAEYQGYKYLFSYNIESNNYEVTIPQIDSVGVQKIKISLFNSSKEIIQDVPVSIFVDEQLGDTSGLRELVVDNKARQWVLLGSALVVLILFMVLTRYLRRHK